MLHIVIYLSLSIYYCMMFMHLKDILYYISIFPPAFCALNPIISTIPNEGDNSKCAVQLCWKEFLLMKLSIVLSRTLCCSLTQLRSCL